MTSRRRNKFPRLNAGGGYSKNDEKDGMLNQDRLLLQICENEKKQVPSMCLQCIQININLKF